MVIFVIFQLWKNWLGGLAPNGSEHPVHDQWFYHSRKTEPDMKINKVETTFDYHRKKLFINNSHTCIFDLWTTGLYDPGDEADDPVLF